MRNRNHFDVLISGAGPAALATAWEALQAGKSVCLVSDRPQGRYTREQKVFLFPRERTYLKYMLHSTSLRTTYREEDHTFLYLLHDRRWIKIKEIEEFLYRRLQDMQARHPQRVAFIERSMISDVYLHTGEASIVDINDPHQKNQEILFDYLVGADGVHHHAAQEVNKNLLHQKIKYTRDIKNVRQYHLSVFVVVKKTDEKPFDFTVNRNRKEYTRIGVAKNGYYSLGMFVTQQNHASASSSPQMQLECNLNREINKVLYNAYFEAKAAYFANEDDEVNAVLLEKYRQAANAIEQFIMDSIRKEIPEENFVFEFNRDNNGIANFNLFMTVLYQANNAFVLIENKAFVLVGDAFRTPYYPLGHGINDAFKETRALKAVFKSNPVTLKESLNKYAQVCKSNAKRAKTNAFVSSLFRSFFFKRSTQVINDLYITSLGQTTLKLIIDADIAKLDALYEQANYHFYVRDSSERNVLHWLFALPADNVNKILEWFLKKDRYLFNHLLAETNNDDESPIHVLMQHINALTFLPKIFPCARAATKYRDDLKNTLAHSAVSKQNIETVRWALGMSPGLFEVENSQGLTAVDLMCMKYQSAPPYNKKRCADILMLMKQALPTAKEKIDTAIALQAMDDDPHLPSMRRSM